MAFSLREDLEKIASRTRCPSRLYHSNPSRSSSSSFYRRPIILRLFHSILELSGRHKDEIRARRRAGEKMRAMKNRRHEIANGRGSERWKYIKHKFQNVGCGRVLCVCIRLRAVHVHNIERCIIHTSRTSRAAIFASLRAHRANFFTFYDNADYRVTRQHEELKIFFQ